MITKFILLSLSEASFAMLGCAPINIDPYEGPTRLMLAAKNGDVSSTQKLLESAGGLLTQYVCTQNDVHKTALHYACENGCCEIIRMLLASGANLNACDYSNGTPLHCAVQYLKRQAVALLLHLGADPFIYKQDPHWQNRGIPLQLADNCIIPPYERKKISTRTAIINLLLRYSIRGSAICSICYGNFIIDDFATLLPCGHLFRHAACGYSFTYCSICDKEFEMTDETKIVLTNNLLSIINRRNIK